MRKFNFYKNLTRITGTLHEDLSTFMIITHSFILMRNFSNRVCRENQNTQFMFRNFFFPENGAVYEIMWKRTVEPDAPQTTI